MNDEKAPARGRWNCRQGKSLRRLRRQTLIRQMAAWAIPVSRPRTANYWPFKEVPSGSIQILWSASPDQAAHRGVQGLPKRCFSHHG